MRPLRAFNLQPPLRAPSTRSDTEGCTPTMADQNTQDHEVPTAGDIDADNGGVAVATERSPAKRSRSGIVAVRSDLYDEEEYDPEEYEALLEMYEDTLTNIEEGEIVTARV